MLNPMFLNSVLNRALRCSMSGESDLAQNISFSLKYLPTMLERNGKVIAKSFIDSHMCIYNWAKQGILFLKDILTEEGTFLKFSDLKQLFKIKGTYLDYIRLQKDFTKAWRDLINNKAIENTYLLTIPPILNSVKLLCCAGQGCGICWQILHSGFVGHDCIVLLCYVFVCK